MVILMSDLVPGDVFIILPQVDVRGDFDEDGYFTIQIKQPLKTIFLDSYDDSRGTVYRYLEIEEDQTVRVVHRCLDLGEDDLEVCKSGHINVKLLKLLYF